MKNFLIFIGGVAVGIFTARLILFLLSLGIHSDNLENNLENEIQVTYIEVIGKKGNVTVHTGMSKDSVQILVGKPDEVDLYEVGNTQYETWGYKLKNEYVPEHVPEYYRHIFQRTNLVIDFEDNKLKGLR